MDEKEETKEIKLQGNILTMPASIGHVHTYFLEEGIDEPAKYRDLSTLLMTAPETDTIRLMINGPGGYLTTAIQLCNLIQTSSALVEAHIMGDACSAQGMIALACHAWYTYPTSRVMLHTYRGGLYGKNTELRDSLESDTLLIHEFLTGLATHFLTEDEMKEMLEYGKDIWVQGEDLTKRFENLHNHRMLIEKQLEIEALDAQKQAIEQALADRLDTDMSNTGSASDPLHLR